MLIFGIVSILLGFQTDYYTFEKDLYNLSLLGLMSSSTVFRGPGALLKDLHTSSICFI